MKNAPILILDEATTYADPENKFQIFLLQNSEMYFAMWKAYTVSSDWQITAKKGGDTSVKKAGSLYCITAGNPTKVIKPAVWTVLAVFAIVLYFFERKAVHATYHDGYDASAKGRVQLAEHIRKLPLGFLMSKDSGEMGNTMMNDFAQSEEAVTHVLPQLIGGLITAILGFIGMSFVDWRLALAMFAGISHWHENN